MAIKCRIWWDVSTQSYVLSLVPDRQLKEVVTVLKMLIPSGDRDYDEKTHFWYMKEQYGEAVRGLAQKVYGISGVSFVSKTTAEQASAQRPPTLSGSPASIQQVFNEFVALVNNNGAPLVTFDEAKRAYRKASLQFHPDHGNEPEKMLRLNELWSRVQKEYFKR